MAASPRARVLGAGPTGALAALALADAGWSVSLHDPLPAASLLRRHRAYAFTHSSRRLLQSLGLWQALLPTLVPFRRLRLLDRWLRRCVSFTAADLAGPTAERRPDLDPAAAVGWIGRHGIVMGLLLRRLRRHPAVRLQLGGPAQPEPEAVDLVVAADGPASPTRGRLGIGWPGWAYRQSCLTVQVLLRGAADDEAWEILRPEGPFAVLPLGRRRFQIVWSAPRDRCCWLADLPPTHFLELLTGVLPEGLEPDLLLDRPRAFPVELRLAPRLRRGASLLVGESAHRCHPVGGQGLNLCWRDVAVLHQLARAVAAGRLPPRRLGRAYARRRRLDLLLTLLSTDLLVRIYSNRQPLLWLPRRLAMALLARLRPLRRILLGLMTDGACPGPPARAP
jgi:2-octaprenyl-6-methoxyphenol hydroxylase